VKSKARSHSGLLVGRRSLSFARSQTKMTAMRTILISTVTIGTFPGWISSALHEHVAKSGYPQAADAPNASLANRSAKLPLKRE
jgi:hypothetical protein